MHTDNPLWWDEVNCCWTEAGESYISKLKNMTGYMRQRFYEGKWVGAEGLIYTEYNPEVNLVDPWPIPKHWTRYLSIDFGYNNPFVCQWWAEDEDGRLYRYRELYGTNTTVEDWAHQIHELSGKEVYKAIICDHDMEDRATLERHITHSEDNCMGGKEKNQRRLPNKRQQTVGADKERRSVQIGIEQVQHRLKVQKDGKPRLYLFKNALVEADTRLLAQKKPTCTEEEIDNYVWDEVKSSRLGDRVLEQPRKVDDHGMDAMRYIVRHVDARITTQPTLNIFGKSVKHSYKGGNVQGGDEIILDKMQWWKDK
jgi:phage terminase large subunit